MLPQAGGCCRGPLRRRNFLAQEAHLLLALLRFHVTHDLLQPAEKPRMGASDHLLRRWFVSPDNDTSFVLHNAGPLLRLAVRSESMWKPRSNALVQSTVDTREGYRGKHGDTPTTEASSWNGRSFRSWHALCSSIVI